MLDRAELRGALALHHREQRRLPLLQRLHLTSRLFQLELELHLGRERLRGAGGGDLESFLELIRGFTRELVLHLGEPRGRRRFTAGGIRCLFTLDLSQGLGLVRGSPRGFRFLGAARRGSFPE